MTTTRDTEAFTGHWQIWHRERVDAATDPYGLAAVTGTHWLTGDPTEIPGVTGRWSVRDGAAVGIDIADAPVHLAVGATARFGEVEVRALAREGDVAIRVVDPGAGTRADLIDIDSYRPDPAWVVEGRFTPACPGSTITIEHVDGAVTVDPLAGWVAVTVGGVEHTFAAFPSTDGRLQISFNDTTNGTETARFRFLSLPAPDADGRVAVDFNRAYLPPSTFTDHYLCPLPPQQNRIPIAVRSGEKIPVTGAISVSSQRRTD